MRARGRDRKIIGKSWEIMGNHGTLKIGCPYPSGWGVCDNAMRLPALSHTSQPLVRAPENTYVLLETELGLVLEKPQPNPMIRNPPTPREPVRLGRLPLPHCVPTLSPRFKTLEIGDPPPQCGMGFPWAPGAPRGHSVARSSGMGAYILGSGVRGRPLTRRR